MMTMHAAENTSEMTFCVGLDPEAPRDEIRHFGACARGDGVLDRDVAELVVPYRYGEGRPLGGDAYPEVRRAVIGIHGAGGNAGPIFHNIHDDILAAASAPDTWLVTPTFESQNDCSLSTASWHEDNDLGFAVGGVSVCPRGVRVSSFDVLDHIVRQMRAQAPALEEIFIIGFSGGARFVNRYSIATPVESELSPLRFRYIMASPGSYLYLSNHRYWLNERNLSQDQGATRFAGDDFYPFGLKMPPHTPGAGYESHYDYVYQHVLRHAEGKPAFARDRVKDKYRLFLVGGKDSKRLPGDTEGERSQGPHRRSRALNYLHHLHAEQAAAHTGLFIIKGADHHILPMIDWYAAMSYWEDAEDGVIDEEIADTSAAAKGGRRKRKRQGDSA